MFNKKYERLATSIAMGFAISHTTISYAANQPAKEQTQDSNTENSSSKDKKATTAEIMGAIGAIAIPGSNAKATVNIIKGGGNGAKILPQCKGTKAPTQNESASFTCALIGQNQYGVIYGAALPIKGGVAGGKQDLGSIAVFQYIEKIVNNRPVWRTGYAQITVGINGYQGKTSIGGTGSVGDFGPDGSPFDGSPFGPSTGNGGGGEVWGIGDDPIPGLIEDSGDDPPHGGSLCFDGSYICTAPEDNPGIWDIPNSGEGASDGGVFDGSGGGGDGEAYPGYYDEDGRPHDGENPYPGGHFDEDGKWNKGKTPDGFDSDSDSNYGDTINKLLNDTNGRNNSDLDWGASHSGTDGSDTLDDYLSGISESNTSPEGLTDNILGVDEGLFDGINGETGLNENIDYEENSDDESWVNDQNELEDNAATWNGTEGSLQDLLNSFDGISGTSSITEEKDGESDSLADTLQKFLKTATGDAGIGNSIVSASDQELYDLAKKLIMANGLSLEDIANGKNYDKGSAYTEPKQAWNMNRITTLLKEKKIKLDGDAIQERKEKNSLSNASQQNQNVRNNSRI